MKKRIIMLLLLALTVSLFGCGTQPEATVPPLDENRTVQHYLLTGATYYGSDGTTVRSYAFDYDEHGRMINESLNFVVLPELSYEKTYGYNAYGRLNSVDYAEESPWAHTYYTYEYTDGGLVAAYDGEDKVYRFTYDAEGRMVEMNMEHKTNPSVKENATCEYDKNGRLSKVSHNTHSETWVDYSLSYDDQGRVIRYEDGSTSSNYVYEYDEEGRLIRMYNEGYRNWENHDTDWNCTYDENGKLTAIDAPELVYSEPEYFIDQNGNIEKICWDDGTWVEFAYKATEISAEQAETMPAYVGFFGERLSVVDYADHIEDYFLPKIHLEIYVDIKY